MKQPQIGVAVMIRHKDKFLFAKRLTKHEYGKYGVPGGKLDFGETLEQAGHRETFEETGKKLKSIKMIPIIANNVYSNEGLHFVCFWFEGELDVPEDWDGKIDFFELDKEGKIKTEGWKWFSSDECKQIPLMRSTAIVLELFETRNNEYNYLNTRVVDTI